MIDQAVLELLQYALVEPPDAGASWPSGLWTRDEVITGLNTRMRQFLRDTQAIAAIASIPVVAGTNPIVVPADWIATLAGVFVLTATGVRIPLSTSDAFEVDLAVPTWEATGGTPIVVLDGDDGTLTVRLAPVPDANGTLDLLYVALPVAANGNGVTLSIPDEMLDGIRYGTLADLLGKIGRGADPMRAQYAQERFEQTELLTEIILGGWA